MKTILCHVMACLCLLVLSGAASAGPANPPSRISIGSMSQLFEAVNFDHDAHVEIAGGCAACHHHTTGDGTGGGRCARCHAQSPPGNVVACSSCHQADPFTASQLQTKADDRFQYHVDKPGLKAAYHWNCLGCHEESGGPTGCEDCHPRTGNGDALYRTGLYAPPPVTPRTH